MSKLYIVPTPIGNLQDMTLRAINILQSVDLILAEDTRNTKFLCQHFAIETPVQSYHKDNEHKVLSGLIAKLQTEMQMALVSDAGTPGISDPGFLLVRECIKNNIAVECLPGATAFVPALINSGFPCDKFVFEGFLPHQKGRQTRWLALKEETRSIVFYESPYRVIKFLNEAKEFCGEDREIAVSRELTKKFEETVRGSILTVLNHFTNKEPKGEFVIVLKGKSS